MNGDNSKSLESLASELEALKARVAQLEKQINQNSKLPPNKSVLIGVNF